MVSRRPSASAKGLLQQRLTACTLDLAHSILALDSRGRRLRWLLEANVHDALQGEGHWGDFDDALPDTTSRPQVQGRAQDLRQGRQESALLDAEREEQCGQSRL